VEDVSLTDGNVAQVVAEKISYYHFFKMLESASIRVEVKAFVCRFAENIIDESLSPHLLYDVTSAISRFNAIMIYLSSNRLDFAQVYSYMEGTSHELKDPFVFPKVTEIEQEAAGFWKEAFNTYAEFKSFKESTGIFSYLNHSIKEESEFFNSLCEKIKARVASKSRKYRQVTQTEIETSVEAFRDEYNSSLSGKDVISVPPLHAKLVPFPYLALNLVDSDKRRDSCFELIMSGKLIPTKPSLTKDLLIFLRDSFRSTPLPEVHDFNHGPGCPERIAKNKLEKMDESTKMKFSEFSIRKDNAKKEERACIVGRRKVSLPSKFWTKDRYESFAMETGEGKLKIFGKDKIKQFESEAWYSLDCDTSIVEDLKGWICREGHSWDTSKLRKSDYRSSKWVLEKSIRQEADSAVNTWLEDVDQLNLFSMSEFYNTLFMEFAFMSEDISRHKEVVLSSLGTNDTLVIMWGGPMLSSVGSTRVVQIVKKLNLRDDFPFLSSCKSYIENDLLILEPVRITEQQIAHYIKIHKATLDTTLGTLMDSGRSYDSMTDEDKEAFFFTSNMVRFSNDKAISTSLTNIRYIGMALLADFGDLTGMMKKAVEPGRKLMFVYFWNKVMSNMLVWKDQSDVKTDLRKQAQNIVDGKGERKRNSVCITKRLLSGGMHANFDETVNEWYFGHAASKEIRNHYHEMARAINKLVETYERYKFTKKCNPNLSKGYDSSKSDTEFLDDVLDSNVKIGTWSMRAANYASKLLEQETSGDSVRIKQNILFGDLNKPVSTLATTKSAVKERTEKMTLLDKEPTKTVNSSGAKPKNKIFSEAIIRKMIKDPTIENSKYRRMGEEIIPTRAMVSDKKTKTIATFFKSIHETGEVRIDRILSRLYHATTPFYFTLFPKPQIGGPREIAIQDLMTRLTTFVMERVAEEVNKNLESESLTDREKFIRQESYISDCRRELVNSLREKDSTTFKPYFFNNEDNTRWGPGMIPMMFAVIAGRFAKGVSSECFDFFLNGCLQMIGKLIEIPKCIYEKWDNKFVPKPSDPMYEQIMKFKENLSITMQVPVGMMQGILHENSSTLAVARIALTKKILNKLWPGIFRVRSMAGSDDKFDAVTVTVDKDIPGDYEDKVRIFLSVNEMTGKLMNVWRSAEKSVTSRTVGEMNSNFIFDGDTASRNFTEYNSIAVIGKGISYESDVRSGIASLAGLARANCTELNLCLFQRTLKMQIDGVYQTGKGGKNSVEDKFEVLREYLPIEIGGFPILTGPSLISGPIESHNFKVCHFGNNIERNSLIHLATFEDTSIYNIFADSGQISDLTGISKTSINFAIRIVSKVENLAKEIESYGYDRDSVRKTIEEKPYVPFITANTPRLTLVRLASQIYSFSSLVAFSYSTDTSNQVRMAKNATSAVCHLGHYKKVMDSGPEGDKSIAVDKRTFLDCCCDVINAEVTQAQKDSFSREVRLAFSDNSKLIATNELMSAWRMAAFGDNYIAGTYKTRWSNVCTPNPTPGTKNSPSSVLTAVLFPEAVEDSMNLLRYPFELGTDYFKLKERYPYLRESMAETCAEVYGISVNDVTEENKKVIYTHLMAETMGVAKKKIQIRSQSRREYLDDHYLGEHLSTSIARNRVYSIEKVEASYEIPFRLGSTVMLGKDELNRTKIIQCMCSMTLYIRERVKDNYPMRGEEELSELIREQTVESYRYSSITELRRLDTDKRYTSFLGYLNYCDVGYELSKMETTSLTHAFLTLGAIFSNRPHTFLEMFRKSSSGWAYFYPTKVKKDASKSGVRYAKDQPVTLTAFSPDMYFEFEKTAHTSSVSIEIKRGNGPQLDIDFTAGIKLIQNYTSYGHFSSSVKVALACPVDFSEFVPFSSVNSKDKFFIAKRGNGVSIKHRDRIREKDLVSTCSIKWKSLNKQDYKSMDPFNPVYTPNAFRSAITVEAKVKNVLKTVNVMYIRDGLFDPTVIFSSDSDNYWGAAGELKAFMDNGLFSGRCRIDLKRKENLVKFELHSHRWIDQLAAAHTWMADSFIDVRPKYILSPKETSSPNDSDESEDIDMDDFFEDYDPGNLNEDNGISDFADYSYVETVDFDLTKKGKASISIAKRMEAAEVNLMQEYTKQVIVPLMERFKKVRGSDCAHSTACYIAACCIGAFSVDSYEPYLGDMLPRNTTYSDCFDPMKRALFTEEEIDNAERKYRRLKMTCIAYAMLTTVKANNRACEITEMTHYARASLAADLRIPTDNIDTRKFDEMYEMFMKPRSEELFHID